MDVYADNYFDCGRNCHIDLLYRRLHLPYGARRICFLAYHTFDATRDVLLSEDSVPKSVFAVIAMSVLLFVLRCRCSIGGLETLGGRCRTTCQAAPLVTSSYDSICLLFLCVGTLRLSA